MSKKEFDPTGTDAHAPGAKLDGGKCKAGVLLDFFSRSDGGGRGRYARRREVFSRRLAGSSGWRNQIPRC